MTDTATALSPEEELERLTPRLTPLDRIQRLLHAHPELGPLIVLVGSCVVFGFLSSRFLTANNISLMLQQVSVVAALGVAQTMIILTAGIDLSIGAAMILGQLYMAQLAANNHVAGAIALLIGLLVAIATGVLNGVLVTRLRLPPFIVTLGTLSIFTSITLIYAQGQVITLEPGTFLTWTGSTISIGRFDITIGVLMMLVLYAVFAYALRQTAWGRHLYATGDDAEAARLAGIRTNRVLLSAYVVAGLVVGIAAWIQ